MYSRRFRRVPLASHDISGNIFALGSCSVERSISGRFDFKNLASLPRKIPQNPRASTRLVKHARGGDAPICHEMHVHFHAASAGNGRRERGGTRDPAVSDRTRVECARGREGSGRRFA